ncbi:hypothetical protein EUGRSUZ_K03253 [Eucalyptus grandis]|uniref:Uncharacterized protein n=2 Tax=Eucalyptus grandis TaxID=71139 RepID=A0ACC3IYX8_EUCGR|nr:hypothetical protein EUGRSUZ_K03253 [Eucalyptus grandis]
MEDQDGILLSSLGVVSANPEDIERDILAHAFEAKGNARDGKDPEGEVPENPELSSSAQEKLYNKLKAIQFEIDAVASTVEQVKDVKSVEGGAHEGSHGGNDADEDPRNVFQASFGDSSLHHALASDRLRSLRETQAQLEKELVELREGNLNKSNDDYRLLRNLVKEKPRLKRKSKAVLQPSKNLEKRQKIVSFRDDDDFDAVLDGASNGFIETERDALVRKGVLTPFHKLKGYERGIQDPEPSKRFSLSEQEASGNDLVTASVDRAVKSMLELAQARPTTKLVDSQALPKLEGPTTPFQRLKKPPKALSSHESEGEKSRASGKKKRPLPSKKWRNIVSREERQSTDYGDVQEEGKEVDKSLSPCVVLKEGLKIPESIFTNLFDYQKVGVQWLWELHCQKAGGIIGDEMGLGKTIQVLSFLGALHVSGMYKPSIVVCPVTLLRQWKREAKKWYPKFHVEILHDSSQDSYSKKSKNSYESDDESEGSLNRDYEETSQSKNSKKWDPLIKRVLRSESGLLITTYEHLRLLGDKLLDIVWGYAVLDEGHRIRNPNAEITLVCKQLQTVHRIIMTGAPIQNRLTELWSLFDFVFPGKLGVLPVFEAEFAVPITVGGYANASPLQVTTAYRCAVVLRDLVMPYLLRRMKADVNAHLPKKTEHVLFCSLNAEQRSVYRAFLASSEVEQILGGSKNSLYGIDVMRKICNHPDLLEREHAHHNPDYGNPERSGKMKVVAEVLKVWKEKGHRVLLFAQTQQMLDILESFLVSGEYKYRRMDGLTPVKQRMALIDEFNNSDEVFIFILTTKVGGLGTNLTGANRVIIFDPDWNPSTDMQARERAWRIGQTRDVTVYRLITRGTIEEKVYHRQIYKHFLTNKILKNPQQRRIFKARDMKDLFTFNDDGESGTTETSNIFSQLSEDVIVIAQQNARQDKGKGLNVAASKDGDCASSSKSYTGSSGKKGKERVNDDSEEVDGEADILKGLLEASGIHSAVNHDIIMNAHDEEKIRLEEQASQIAKRAAEALRQSRMMRSHDSVSVPTWTGKSGMAGAPSSAKKKFGATVSSKLSNNSSKRSSDESSSNGTSNGIVAGVQAGKALSSAELLAKIRGTQQRALSSAEHGSVSGSGDLRRPDVGSSTSSHSSSHVQPEILTRQICTFLQQRGGITDSATISQHFRDRISDDDSSLFRSQLKAIATLEKDPNGSVWILKPEYQ